LRSLIPIVCVLAVTQVYGLRTVALAASQGAATSQQAARTDSSVRATDTAIFAAIIAHKFAGKSGLVHVEEQTLSNQEVTKRGMFPMEPDGIDRLLPAEPTIFRNDTDNLILQELRDDFAERNTRAVDIPRFRSVPLNVLYSPAFCLSAEQTIAFALPGYAPDGLSATAFYEKEVGDSSSAAVVYLRRESEGWRVVKEFSLWFGISCGPGFTTSEASRRLTRAAAEGDLGRVRRLISKGVNVDTPDLSSSPLMVAAFYGQDALVKLLLQKGANPDRVSRKGRTALMFAARQGQTEVVKRLLGAGASASLKDDAGNTAVKLATLRGHEQIVALLRKAGAKE
jgi:hypothetical protein